MDSSKGLLAEVVTIGFLLLHLLASTVAADTHYYTFIVKEVSYSRLCHRKNIVTVNGQYPGPTLYVHKGDTAIVDVRNHAHYNITIHWHGVKQPRNPWSDGPEYVTQCPIQPRMAFKYEISFSDEEGTLWWHAHSDWTRSTVHGAIVIHPKPGTTFPFPKPHNEIPIILGEWWKSDVNAVLQQALQLGGEPNVSDAFTINGQPGNFYPCSKSGSFRMLIERGKTYLLRVVNAAMNDELFFAIAKHQLMVVGTDASYTKPFPTDYIMITPGQTIDILVEANQVPDLYYMAASAYSTGTNVSFDNTTTTAILQYITHDNIQLPPTMPTLPAFNDTTAAFNFTSRLRSLGNEGHPVHLPLAIHHHMLITVSVNTLPCPSCLSNNSSRLSASLNNISFVNPSVDILRAYYLHMSGVFGGHFPDQPPLKFNFTGDNLPANLSIPQRATEVKFLKYNSTVEIILQGTSLVVGENHPMHLHGFSFYVVGMGVGNYHRDKDSQNYNLVDPPLVNTIGVPKNGWVAIRFRANNPGVWFMHCHLERHLSWGMNTVFIVENGRALGAQLRPPPQKMPPC